MPDEGLGNWLTTGGGQHIICVVIRVAIWWRCRPKAVEDRKVVVAEVRSMTVRRMVPGASRGVTVFVVVVVMMAGV